MIKYPHQKKYTKADMVLDVVSVVGATILLFLAMTLERL
jgi:hypothetical protein